MSLLVLQNDLREDVILFFFLSVVESAEDQLRSACEDERKSDRRDGARKAEIGVVDLLEGSMDGPNEDDANIVAKFVSDEVELASGWRDWNVIVSKDSRFNIRAYISSGNDDAGAVDK